MLTIYTHPDCRPCRALKEYLNDRGVKYVEKDVEKDVVALAELERLGIMELPVVVTESGEKIVGFSRTKLEEAIRGDGGAEGKAATPCR